MGILDIFFKKDNKLEETELNTTVSQENQIIAARTYSDEDLVLSMDNFIKELKIKMTEANIKLEHLEYNVMSDKTYNFKYMGCQIGRMKITKKSSGMQILTASKVTWIENKHVLDYYKNIDKWIKYTKYIIRSEKEYY